jgi:hypothetical protein
MAKRLCLLLAALAASHAEDACEAGLTLQREGKAKEAAKVWLEHVKAPPGPTTCPAAEALLGITLVRSNELDDGVKHLRVAIARDATDFVSAGYLGAAHELLARRLAAQGLRKGTVPKASQGHRRMLEVAIGLLRSAVANRATFFAKAPSERPFMPQLEFAQPPTFLFRSLGNALLWLGREREARGVFVEGAAAGIGWVTPWARPTHPLPLVFGRPRPFFDQEDASPFAPLLRAFEAGLDVVRSEFLALHAAAVRGSLPEGFQYEAAGLHDDQSWSIFLLGRNGQLDEGKCADAPATCSLVRAAPLTSVRDGQVKFSVLSPGSHILPHAGPSNARLRMHCTLVLFHGGPEAATFRVGPPGQERHWQHAKCFLFDESFEHEVSTASEEAVQAASAKSKYSSEGSRLHGLYRAVLLVDIANPLLAKLEDFKQHGVSETGWAAHEVELTRAWTEANAWAAAGTTRSEL